MSGNLHDWFPKTAHNFLNMSGAIGSILLHVFRPMILLHPSLTDLTRSDEQGSDIPANL